MATALIPSECPSRMREFPVSRSHTRRALSPPPLWGIPLPQRTRRPSGVTATAFTCTADQPGHRFLEQINLAFLNEKARQLVAELGGNAVQGQLQRAVPVLGIRGFEGLQGPVVLGRWKSFQQRTQLRILRPDSLGANFALAGWHPSRLPYVIPDKDGFQRHRRLCALVAR